MHLFSAVAKTQWSGFHTIRKLIRFKSSESASYRSVDGEWSAEYLYEIAKKQLMQQGTVQQELQLTIDELRLQGKQATKKLIDHMEKGTLLKSKVPFILF